MAGDPRNMAVVQGYDGGDGEEQLLAALREIMASAEADSWEKIRVKYMKIGSITEIARARGYIKNSRLGFVGWCVSKIGYGETTARDSFKCWEKRRDFDAVRAWVAENNTFKPGKLSGPLLYLDAHKAWSQRLRPDATPRQQARKLTAKELRQLVQAYRSMLDRSGGVITKWAAEDGRDTREWNIIVQERAAIEIELGEGNGNGNGDEDRFPLHATRQNPYPGTVPHAEPAVKPAELVVKEEPKRRGGWPKGKARGPRKPKESEEVEIQEEETSVNDERNAA
jgi:hypothetical protein